MHEIKPFLKWAGGKRKLIPILSEKIPHYENGTFIEPFLGGGALGLHLLQQKDFSSFIFNDVNTSLINTYIVVQQSLEPLLETLIHLEQQYVSSNEEERKKMFYNVRANFNEIKSDIPFLGNHKITRDAINLAAFFIFLNKTCFNGLYRENLSGEFNTPHGRYKNPKIADTANLKSVSELLKPVIFLSTDFENISKYIKSPDNTFVYIDPPYRPLDASKRSFNGYSKGSFDDEQQKRLALWCKKIDALGCKFMLSNSNPKNENPEDTFFDDIFDGFIIDSNIIAARTISAKGSTRKPVKEILVTNF